MSDSCRRSLFFLFSFLAIMIFSVTAFAECDTECDPYSSYCSQYCAVCTHYTMDGCDRWRDSSCGNELGACLQDNCTPNWVVTSSATRGTYDGRSFSHCNHHVVSWKTAQDYNYCNINTAYQTHSYCSDDIDDWRNVCCYPPCCDRWGDNGTYMTCDGNHSC